MACARVRASSLGYPWRICRLGRAKHPTNLFLLPASPGDLAHLSGPRAQPFSSPDSCPFLGKLSGYGFPGTLAGAEGVARQAPGGRRCVHLSLREEQAFLPQWAPKAEQGQILTGKQWRGRVSSGDICLLMHHWGWGKLGPMPPDPEAAPETGDASEKNSPARRNPAEPIALW